MNRFYKVVTKDLRSISYPGSDIECQYKVGEFVFPKINKMMVFSSKEDSFRFLRENENCKLFECEVINPSNSGFWVSVVLFNIYRHFMNDSFIPHSEVLRSIICDNSINRRKFGLPPEGTIFCEGVKLIKEMVIK